MEVRPRRTLASLAPLALAVALLLAFALWEANRWNEGAPHTQHIGRLISLSKAVTASVNRKPACALEGGAANGAGKSELMSAGGKVVSTKDGAEINAPLARCSSATLLGGWDNNTYVPLPYDALAPFLDEARGMLSQAERRFFLPRREGVEVAPKYLPVNNPVGLSEDEPVSFHPPCYYHFYNKKEIMRLFAGKWVYFLGDSNTRGMFIGFLATLDPEHRSPYVDEKWFNGTKDEVNWPHVNNIHYFFREDGSILFKTGRGSTDQLPTFPESGYSFRLSYTMSHDIEYLIQTANETLGDGEWAPDVLHFSSGAWDSGALKRPEEWNLTRVDRGYGRMFDLIAEKCNPKRQVCFWGTIGSLQQVDDSWWDGLAVLQWRHWARIHTRQVDAGNASTLHILDRYWMAFNRLDQNFGGHMTTAFNSWMPQIMMNAYHSIAEDRGLLANPVQLAQPSRSYRADEVECVLLPGDEKGRKVKCEKYPLRVDFEEGCTIDRDTDVQNAGDTHIMWARSCDPQVTL
ncbi:hypothetical protein KFL_001170080 [Klebsormidium nitens]|uniref:Uncharacterized protein n=1 Tax=Klebsormidium nitens TaxID=105231 RepID=A0A1Y1HWR9_KLENI|nr:hypothetical protein KFL_001170080 [Klebsormidium nitens]|eukprot:GAQ82603.1 hypothetical protein KFL_001170080 [Klebsormidium nitens]